MRISLVEIIWMLMPASNRLRNMRDIFLARTYRGSFGGSSRPDEDYPKFVEWFQQGKLDLNRLVTARYKLDQINEACEALQTGKIGGRAILTFDM